MNKDKINATPRVITRPVPIATLLALEGSVGRWEALAEA